MQKKWLRGVLFAGVLTAVGCSDDDTTAPGPDAPAIPPSSSLEFDLGFFDSALRDGAAGDTQDHWVTSAFTLFVINTMMTAALTPPAAVLEIALSAEPEYLGDNVWQWNYSWTDGTDTAGIRLRGEFMESESVDQVSWQLFITNTAEQQDNVLWFQGNAASNGRSGQWTFFDIESGNFVDEFVQVDWAIDDEVGLVDRNLTFSVHMGENDGDSLAYDVLGNAVSVTLHDESEAADAVIAWDDITGAGFIEAPDYNGGVRGCWDESQIDVECPPLRAGF